MSCDPNAKAWKSWDQDFGTLGQQIVSMIEFITPRSNIHGEIKKGMNAMKATFDRNHELNSGLTLPVRPAVANQCAEVQTSTLLGHGRRGAKTDGTPKRKDTLPSPRAAEGLKKARMRPENSGQQALADKGIAPAPVSAVVDPSWSELVTRKSKKEEEEHSLQQDSPRKEVKTTRSANQTGRKSAIRWNALIIRPADQNKYAKILKHIKTDEAPQNGCGCVYRIFKTAAGDMLILVTKGEEEQGHELQKALVREALE